MLSSLACRTSTTFSALVSYNFAPSSFASPHHFAVSAGCRSSVHGMMRQVGMPNPTQISSSSLKHLLSKSSRLVLLLLLRGRGVVVSITIIDLQLAGQVRLLRKQDECSEKNVYGKRTYK